MIYLLDSSAVSELMANRGNIRQKIRSLQPGDQLVTCPIVRGEILHGIGRLDAGKRRDDLMAASTEAFNAAPPHAMPGRVGDEYAQIKLDCQKRGLPLDENDLWIAATARVLGAAVVSRDQHFGRISGLIVEDWTK